MNIYIFKKKQNLIFLFFSLLPVSFILGKAILELNIILIIFFFLKDIIDEKKSFKLLLRNKSFLPLFLLWIYLNFNVLNSSNIDSNLIRGLFFFKNILLVFAFIYYLKLKSFRNKIINYWTVILLIVSFDIYFEFIFGKNILGFESPMKNERIMSFFKDELIVGSFLATFLFIIFGKFYDSNKTFLSFILFLVISIAIFLTGERSITLKLLVSIILIIVFVLKSPKLKILIMLLSCFLILFMLKNENLNYRYKNTFLEIQNNFQNKNIYEGLLHIKYLNQAFFSYEILKENYLFGVGTKNYFKACINLKNTSENERIKEKTFKCFVHPHQTYYEFISEHGIIGTIIILLSIIMLFYNKDVSRIDDENKRKLFIFKIYIILSLLPVIPTGSFFSSLNLFQFFLNYAFYLVYYKAKYLDYRKNVN
jgi:O-antigen ligase